MSVEVVSKPEELPIISDVHDTTVKGVDGHGQAIVVQKPALSLQSILESLSVIFNAEARIQRDALPDLDELLKHGEIAVSQIDKLDPELSFVGDVRGSWCLTVPRMRNSSEKWKNYPEFLSALLVKITALLAEFYRIFRIRQKGNGSHTLENKGPRFAGCEIRYGSSTLILE